MGETLKQITENSLIIYYYNDSDRSKTR